MPIVERNLPFAVVCDECGESLGTEEMGGEFLHEDVEAAASSAADYEWRVADGIVTCPVCLYEIAADSPEGAGD